MSAYILCLLALPLLTANASAFGQPCFPALFSFGSSQSDTGAAEAAFPLTFGVENLPYGSTYFKRPSGRFSDGRIPIDFWAHALGIPFLSPYLRAQGSDFRHGANFACAGATARATRPPSDANSSGDEEIFPSLSIPFSSIYQLRQFLHFKQAAKTDRGRSPTEKAFNQALYVVSIGANDYTFSYQAGETPHQALGFVADVVQAVMAVVEGLYEEGARTILVEDIYPQGCAPSYLAFFAGAAKPEEFDDCGCLISFNDVNKAHNAELKKRVDGFNRKHEGASVVLVATYQIRYDMICRPAHYGFHDPLQSCCGNFATSFCGLPFVDSKGNQVKAAEACAFPSRSVSWDGVHFTDASNLRLMHLIFTRPPFRIPSRCNLTVHF